MSHSTTRPTLDDPAIRIPARAATLAGCRAWALSDEFPKRGRFSFINGELFIDMSPEELEARNKVKTEVVFAIANLDKGLDLGEFYSDGPLVTNEAADLSTEPDGTFVTWRSFAAGRGRLTPLEDRPGQYIELQGPPDWVLEVVSQSSVAQDTRVCARPIIVPASPNPGSSMRGPTRSKMSLEYVKEYGLTKVTVEASRFREGAIRFLRIS